jgi:hypothetical protein
VNDYPTPSPVVLALKGPNISPFVAPFQGRANPGIPVVPGRCPGLTCLRPSRGIHEPAQHQNSRFGLESAKPLLLVRWTGMPAWRRESSEDPLVITNRLQRRFNHANSRPNLRRLEPPPIRFKPENGDMRNIKWPLNLRQRNSARKMATCATRFLERRWRNTVFSAALRVVRAVPGRRLGHLRTTVLRCAGARITVYFI